MKPTSFLLSLFFCKAASAVGIVRFPTGSRPGSWQSNTINSALGIVLRLAANTPGTVVDTDSTFWEHTDGDGTFYRLQVATAMNSIPADVCQLADTAFNALTDGGQFMTVVVGVSRTIPVYFLINKQTINGATRSISEEKHEEPGEVITRRHPITVDGQCPNLATRDEGVIHVTGYQTAGCTGEIMYTEFEENKCHSFSENAAKGFTIHYPGVYYQNLTVHNDPGCSGDGDIIGTDMCQGTDAYQYYKITPLN